MLKMRDSRYPSASFTLIMKLVVDVVPGLDDLQLRFHLGEPAHHVDLEQQAEPVASVVACDGGVALTADVEAATDG